MIELVFTACLAAAASGETPTPPCRERSLLYTDVSLMQCLSGAQVALAEWAGTHPGWQVERHACRPLGTGGSLT